MVDVRSFDDGSLRDLLKQVATGDVAPQQALEALRTLPFECVGDFAVLDHHREMRRRFPETIFCQGKTPAQVAAIAACLVARSGRLLGTRAGPEHYAAALKTVPELVYDRAARVIYVDPPGAEKHPGVAVVAAGTSDLPVAEEAARTLEVFGHAPRRCYDVGVAGLHRLLAQLPLLRTMNVIVAVAGMEGALPGVLAGLVACPVVAVPTSVGYGANLQGIAALLSMLNSCAPGLSVVNIDNGFGAAYCAASINSAIVAAHTPAEASPAAGEEHAHAGVSH